MATPLLDMIRAIIPNFKTHDLRLLIPWFEAASNGINQNSRLLCAAVVDGGANIQRSYNVASVAHPSAGNFAITMTNAIDPNVAYPAANIYAPSSPPAGAINIYPTIASPTQINIAIWQVLAATAVLSQVDEQWSIIVLSEPTDQ